MSLGAGRAPGRPVGDEQDPIRIVACIDGAALERRTRELKRFAFEVDPPQSPLGSVAGLRLGMSGGQLGVPLFGVRHLAGEFVRDRQLQQGFGRILGGRKFLAEFFHLFTPPLLDVSAAWCWWWPLFVESCNRPAVGGTRHRESVVTSSAPPQFGLECLQTVKPRREGADLHGRRDAVDHLPHPLISLVIGLRQSDQL